MLAVGGVVAEVMTGQDTAKKKTGALTWRGDSEGRRRLRQYGIGDGHCCERETRENATGQDMERNQATEMNLPATVPVAMERRQVGVAPL